MTIYVCSKKEWNSENSKGKTLIRKTDNNYYAVSIENPKNELSLTKDEINDSFMLIT